MQPLGLNEIRRKYLDFFASKEHLIKNSFSLVPQNDPSILLINAGMTPLKPYFTGDQIPPSKRISTCQKCIRTPDIERVGLTSRHGTYFEMLGNFSFGDYFKKEAISWAWEFVTQELKMPLDRLYVTVYHEDDEAYDIWHKEIGLPEDRIYRLGKEDNFWEHGTGPCGPCSEIYFDRGVEYGPDDVIGGEGDRFVEFWNLVFSQFDRQEDGSYLPLSQKNIDTGGGLERFACIMQGVDNLFEVDTVKAILNKASEIAKVKYGTDEKTDIALRVITDHARSTTMMISDGILPSNEGRGYVLRRLLRRAVRFGKKLNIDRAFLPEIAEVVIKENCEAYPELVERRDYILKVIATEEKRFETTIEQGLARLNEIFNHLKSQNIEMMSGEEAFKLHDTYGFPVDLTKEIAREHGFSVDELAFSLEMQKQKERARAALKNKNQSAWGNEAIPKEFKRNIATQFVGYTNLHISEIQLTDILVCEETGEHSLAEQIGEGEKATLVLDITPFYATSGGQEGDVGFIKSSTGEFIVESCTKLDNSIFLHHGYVKSGYLQKGKEVTATVDEVLRKKTSQNHSATHLLHKALRDVLGEHVTQAGSFQNSEKIRFDFHHQEAITLSELSQIEEKVNQAILMNYPVSTKIVTLDEAKEAGAMALFGEKYGTEVRMVKMGDSLELCGGTHVNFTSEISYFRILSESSVASGVRRIEAIAGAQAIAYAGEEKKIINTLEDILKVKKSSLEEKIENLLLENRNLKQELKKIKDQQALASINNLLAELKGSEVKYIATRCDVAEADTLKLLADQLILRFKDEVFVVLLASVNEDKINFIVAATSLAIQRGLKAGNLVKEVAQVCEGSGGGKPDLARAGAKNVGKLSEAFIHFAKLIN